MIVELDGHTRTRLPEPIRWLAHLQAAWEDQRGDARLPSADELFLADLADRVPSLLLAHRDEDSHGFRIEFAGAAARTLLELEPVGEVPEHGPAEHPLAWLGAGFVAARRAAVPVPRWLRRDDRLGVFLPYGGFDSRVTLVLAGIARWPVAGGGVAGGGVAGGGVAGGGVAGGGVAADLAAESGTIVRLRLAGRGDAREQNRRHSTT